MLSSENKMVVLVKTLTIYFEVILCDLGGIQRYRRQVHWGERAANP